MFFLVQMFYNPIGYLACIMFYMPRQYFYLISRYHNLDNIRAWDYCACSRCGPAAGWGRRLSFLFSISLSLEEGLIQIKILSEKAMTPHTLTLFYIVFIFIY